jgi:hypothetical protein
MLTVHQIVPESDLTCRNPVAYLCADDFRYFDKDGFELNHAERKFYDAQGYNIHNGILNHYCWDQHWIDLWPDHQLYLDHAMVLYRCGYAGDARLQLSEFRNECAQAALLMQVKPKWGFDFDLNALTADGIPYEVLHIEYDNYDYDTFCQRMTEFEQIVVSTDWRHVAQSVWSHRSEWQGLRGYDQNHWKAKHILDWDLAEYLEKALV